MSKENVLVNGQLSSQASALDRGLLYGQNVFETIAVSNGKACLLDLHLERLRKGCETLDILFNQDLLLAEIEQFIKGQAKAVLRVTQTMGSGGRGYQNPAQPAGTRILSLHDYPQHQASFWEEGITIGMVELRLASQAALAGLKHGNRLEQIIARGQWQPDWQEGLVRDQQDNVIEGTQSNLFIRVGSKLITPKLDAAGVAGVMREFISSQADKFGLQLETMALSVADIKAADEVFLSNSIIGLWPVKRFEKTSYFTFEVAHKLLKLMIKNEVIPHN